MESCSADAKVILSMPKIYIEILASMGSLYEINGMLFIWLVNLYENTNFLIAGSAGITACFFALATVVSNVKINNIEVYAGKPL